MCGTALSWLLCREGGDGRLVSTVRVMGWACGTCGGEEELIQFWWVNVQDRTALKIEAPIHHINIQYILITACRGCAVRGAVTRQASHSAGRSDRQCQSVAQVDQHCKRAVLDQVPLWPSLTDHTVLHSASSVANISSASHKIPLTLLFTTARHLPLTCARSIQSSPSHPVSFRRTLTLHKPSKRSLSFTLPHQNTACISLLLLHATCPAHLILLYLIPLAMS